MKKYLLFALMILFSVSYYAQNENPKDPKAKVILDKVSATNKSFKTIHIKFSYNLVNKANGIDETQEGEVWIKGQKYKMTFPGVLRVSNGTTMWTYLEDDDECQINSAENNEEENFSPANLLTIYENGFNYLFEGTKTMNGKTLDVIKLFPEGGGKPYHTIKLYIDQKTHQMYKIEIYAKDGNLFTYTLNAIQSNMPLEDKLFVFDVSTAGDVIDMR